MNGAASWVRGYRRAVERMNLWMATLAGWLVLVITAITCYGVFMRYVVKRPDTWSFPVSAYLLSFVVFLSVSHALQEKVHVRVDLLHEWFPGRFSRWVEVLADVVSLGFLWLVLLQMWEVFHESWSQGRTDETTLAWQVTAVQWVMPLGALFLLLTQLAMTASRLLEEPEAGPDAPPDPARVDSPEAHEAVASRQGPQDAGTRTAS